MPTFRKNLPPQESASARGWVITREFILRSKKTLIHSFVVIPAKAGIQLTIELEYWIPGLRYAAPGMTNYSEHP